MPEDSNRLGTTKVSHSNFYTISEISYKAIQRLQHRMFHSAAGTVMVHGTVMVSGIKSMNKERDEYWHKARIGSLGAEFIQLRIEHNTRMGSWHTSTTHVWAAGTQAQHMYGQLAHKHNMQMETVRVSFISLCRKPR